MKLRKILALVLAVLMVCTVFAACGNDDASSTASGESSTAETSSTAEESETSEDTSSEATTSETGTDGEGVTLNIRAGMEPTSMNTLNSTYSLEFSLINHMYDKLYMLDENDVPQLSAAETVDISGATVEAPNTLKVDRVDAEHPATFSPSGASWGVSAPLVWEG